MLSEGSVVLLSRHDTSQATRPESFGLGRTFTDRLMCPCLDTANSQAGSENGAALYPIDILPLQLIFLTKYLLLNTFLGDSEAVCRLDQ